MKHLADSKKPIHIILLIPLSMIPFSGAHCIFNLDTAQSQLKSLNFKNPDQDREKRVLTAEKILTGFKS
jgi:hypothetical protein